MSHLSPPLSAATEPRLRNRRRAGLSMIPTELWRAIALAGTAALLNPAAPAAESIELHPQFAIELAAREPLVFDPVDLEFDERGVAFVLEMPGYPEAPEDPRLFPGKVARLEDADGDGAYDRRVVFAEGFQYATSILPYRGGLLVLSPPDLLWLSDINGDGVADQRETLLSGFSVGNSQHNANGLIYGLDNWIYAGNGGNSGSLRWPGSDAPPIPIASRDFRFDLERREIDFIGRTTTGFGIALDDWGRVFTTHNMRHAHHLVFPNRYIERNPFLNTIQPVEIADHLENGLGRIYAIGVQETRVNHPEQSGYFSGACGITYYGGGAFPEGFNGNLFVGDVVLNLVHRDVLRQDGPTFVASRGRPKTEFLASSDRWFRPVNMTVGPDGALYLLDMNRQVIEHPEWIPDELEAGMDLNAGKGRGRVYRITPRGGLPWVQPQFDRGDLEAATKALSASNKWRRDTAQRLLVEWNLPASVPLLEKIVEEHPMPQARTHALWTLQGLRPEGRAASPLGAVRPALLRRALQDPHPAARENALLVAERGLKTESALIDAVLALASDPNPRVRLQCALTAGEINRLNHPRADDATRALVRVARADASNSWSRLAVLSGAGERPLELFFAFLDDGQVEWDAEGVADLAGELAEIIGARHRPEEVLSILGWLEERRRDAASPLASATVSGLAAGLQRGPSLELSASQASRLTSLIKRLGDNAPVRATYQLWRLADACGIASQVRSDAVIESAAKIALDPSAPLSERLERLKLAEFAPEARRVDWLFQLLDFRHPSEMQVAAVQQLSRARGGDVAERLIQEWPNLTPRARALAGDMLIYRSSHHPLLLDALEGGALPLGQMNFDLERRRRLLRSNDPEIRRRAEKLFSDAGVVTRREALEKMKPALSMDGEPDRGKKVFETLCANCHQIAGAGNSVGPDLTDIYRKSAETLLHDILDPNAAVDTEYVAYTVETSSDEAITGILIDQTERSVTLEAAGGQVTVLSRDRIASMTSGGLSLMPEELESGLEPQAMADLLAFLQQRR